MSGKASGAPVLDVASAGFITHHVSMLVASCSRACVPSITRALGCRVSPDRRDVTLFLPVSRSTAVLRDLHDGAAVAVVFSRPSTHETLQLKGLAVRVTSLVPGDHELMQAYGKSLADDIRTLGWQDPFVSALTNALDEEAVAVTFTPSEVFVQTPGPAAGRRLEPKP